MSYENRDTFASFVQGFVLGSLVGAGIALLYAPKPGLETREELLSRSREFKGEAEKQYQQALERAISLKERAEEQIDTLLKQGRERAHDLREKANERIADLKKTDESGDAEKA